MENTNQTRNEQYQEISRRVKELEKELPRISFGYIGNYEYGKDYTEWAIFLPHFGRVGTYSDSVNIGAGAKPDTFTKALENWDKLVAAAHRQYAADSNRLAHVTLRDGVLVVANGTRLLSAQYGAPLFADVAAAEAWLVLYNYPATTL